MRLFSHLGDAAYEPLAARQRVTVRRSEALAVQNETLLAVASAYLELVGAEARLDILRQGETDLAELARLPLRLPAVDERPHGRDELRRNDRDVRAVLDQLRALGDSYDLLRLEEGAIVEGSVDAFGWWVDGADLVVGEALVQGYRAQVMGLLVSLDALPVAKRLDRFTLRSRPKVEATVAFGINNLFDERPPLVVSSFENG